MNDLHFVALALFLGLTLIAVAVLIFGTRLRDGLIAFESGLSITVQAPNSVLPPELMDLMARINEKLAPPTTPAEVQQLDTLVDEGVAIAMHQKGISGADKFRMAREYVVQRAAAMHLEIDDRSLALSIEAAVAMRRLAPKLLPK